MQVFLTGATGFVGSYILRELLKAGHQVRCLVRAGSENKLVVPEDRIEIVHGSITQPESLSGLMDGCDAVIHLVGIIEEKLSKGITFEAVHHQGTRKVVDEAGRAGVTRFVQMSANGADPQGVSEYQRSKWKAEQYVQQAGFDHWVIFRPSIIFGDPGPDRPEFATQLVQSLIKPFPVLPVFGDGLYKMQPVAIEQVAPAFVQALTLEQAHGHVYCTAGKQAFTYLEILDILTRATGRDPKPKIKQPVWLVRPAVQTLGRVGLLPITPDQFEMLLTGNTCNEEAFFRDFDVPDLPFTPENLAYVQ